MSKVLAMMYAAFAGGLSNIQVGTDLKLFRGLNNPALTAVIILSTGLAVAMMALLAWWAVAGVQLNANLVAVIPWWAWLGGALQGFDRPGSLFDGRADRRGGVLRAHGDGRCAVLALAGPIWVSRV